MENVLKRTWNKSKSLAERYPIVIAALFMYGYYLASSYDLFIHTEAHGEKKSFFDYVLQYNSLIFMWLATLIYVRTRKNIKSEKETQHEREMERLLDRQMVFHQLMNEVIPLLQDKVNNPLAIISVTNQEMRRKFISDHDMLHKINRMESAVHRIHSTIRDLESYEARKILEMSVDTFSPVNKSH